MDPENRKSRKGRKVPSLNLPSINRSSSRNSDMDRHSSNSPSNLSPDPRSRSTDRHLPSIHTSKSATKNIIAKFDRGKSSDRICGLVKAYAVNSFAGKHHNEDRVNIIINLPKPSTLIGDDWPTSSLYALFDGHSGKSCAEFLKRNLHECVFNSPHYPYRTKEALSEGFSNADHLFLAKARETSDMSGSCAIMLIVIGDNCFVANVGDSRALISMQHGKVLTWLSSEHKPSETPEYTRIVHAGGKVFNNYVVNDRGENINFGPHLVLPGRLKVSRSFGDLDAKDPQFGGNPMVIISEPEIKSFKIKSDQDFILLASGCLFEKFTGRELVDMVFEKINLNQAEGTGAALLAAIEEIFAEAVRRMCDNNITIVIINLKSSKKYAIEVGN